MPQYWVFAPVESGDPDLYDKVWDYDLLNSTISMGWNDLGDVSKMSREELFNTIAATYPEKPNPTVGLIANMHWNFFHEIMPGDIILARRGRMTLSGIGIVSSPGQYDPERKHLTTIPEHTHDNWMGVKWKESPRDIKFRTQIFPMFTLSKYSEEKYSSLISAIPSEIDGSDDDALESPSVIVLEKYLEEFLVKNFDMIFKGSIRLFEDSGAYIGQQYQTGIGIIDILAVDSKTNDFVVIELKKGQTSDKVVGQTLRYMGWVKKTLCSPNQSVRGIIICESKDEKIGYAIDMTSNISIRYYKISLQLSDTPPS